jgi:hypothetical protein
MILKHKFFVFECMLIHHVTLYNNRKTVCNLAMAKKARCCSRPRSVFKLRPGRHVNGLRTGRFGFVSGSGQWKMALIIGF